MNRVESQQVSWWSVHELIAPVLEAVGDYPMVGTPAWCALADNDARKWAAVLDAGQRAALRWDSEQEALADAAKAICQSVKELDRPTTWSAIAKEAHDLEAFYANRPWLKRRTA